MPSVYEIVTDKLIAELERGTIPWRKPWITNAPRNLVSGKAYRGINVFLLGLTGHASPFWVTFKQAQALGGTVRKGQHGSLVTFWKFTEREVKAGDTDTEPETKTSAMIRYYTVFNIEQCEGITAPAVDRPVINPIETAEAIAAKMPNPPSREASDHAAYRPSTDAVLMPAMQSFHSSEGFYATLFHELSHSTGHASRLARRNVMEVSYFGSDDYSKEELVAEMSASMLCAISGIESVISNSAAYLQSWIKALKGDSRLVVSAASQAQKAADYIQGIA